jgi:hypothetical protein
VVIRERASEANRLQKTLEGAGIKLTSVATDVLGVSGRLMLDALISGTRDPEVLAELAQGTLRKKVPELQRALAGTFKPHHTLIVSHILAHLDYLDQTIATLTAEVERRLAPLARKAENLTKDHRRRHAKQPGDPGRARPGHEPLPLRPARRQLGLDLPRQRRVRRQTALRTHRKGNPYLRAAPIESANAAARSKNTYLRAQYEQLKRRRGHKKAIVAVAHSILIASYHILKDDVPYHDLGADYFTRRADPERITKRLVAQLERLGHIVTLQTSTAQAAVAP